MTCIEIILTLFLSLPRWHQDTGTREARTELYRPTVETVCRVGTNNSERAWLASQAYSETKLARFVLEERCSEGPHGACDHGLATGPWQSHGPVEAWQAATQAERFDAGARWALRHARHGFAVCGAAGSFGFQTGRKVCSGAWIAPRVSLYRLAFQRLEAGR